MLRLTAGPRPVSALGPSLSLIQPSELELSQPHLGRSAMLSESSRVTVELSLFPAVRVIMMALAS